MHFILVMGWRFIHWLASWRPLSMVIIAWSFMTLACASTQAMGYGLGESNRCDSSKFESGHPECLPPPGFFCTEAPPDWKANAAARQNMGQLFSSKEYLGPNQPVCAPNSTRLVQDEDLKRVRQGAHAIGEQMGVVMTQCEHLLDGITRYPDGTIKNWYLTNPESLGVVLQSCADALDKIDDMPSFEDSWLAGAAKHAFEEGYGAGVDEVNGRLFLMELAIDTIEMIVLPEVMLAEVALTRAIRASVAGLRRMPILIPGAVGGVGAIVQLVPKAAASAVVSGSSRLLAKAMRLAGKIRLPGEFAHHIVAHGDPRAKAALDILKKFGIGVDDAVNGVYLPGYKTSPNPLGKVVHGNLHTKAYYDEVNKALESATSQAEVIHHLRAIASKLEHGKMP